LLRPAVAAPASSQMRPLPPAAPFHGGSALARMPVQLAAPLVVGFARGALFWLCYMLCRSGLAAVAGQVRGQARVFLEGAVRSNRALKNNAGLRHGRSQDFEIPQLVSRRLDGKDWCSSPKPPAPPSLKAPLWRDRKSPPRLEFPRHQPFVALLSSQLKAAAAPRRQVQPAGQRTAQGSRASRGPDVLKAMTWTGSLYWPSSRSVINVSKPVFSASVSRQACPDRPKSSSTRQTA
jgi:hypothetical protein